MINKTVNKEAVHLELIGELIAEAVSDLKEQTSSIERDTLVIDFSKADYMGSEFLGWLIRIQKRLVAEGKKPPIMFGCNDNVYNIFEITGTHILFNFQKE